MTHVADWIDLGDGEAIHASRVGELTVNPPWPPSHLVYSRVFTEQITWTVVVFDDGISTWRLVGCYWAEDHARAHARRIVNQMLGAAA